MAIRVTLVPVPSRGRSWRGLLVPALVLILAGGCGHRRAAMRPVYIEPAPAVVAPAPAGCPAGQDCAPGRAVTPGFGDGETLSPPPSQAPARPSLVPRGGGGEPTLNPEALQPTSKPAPIPAPAPAPAPGADPAPAPGPVPSLEPPRQSRWGDPQAAPGRSIRRATLRSRIQAMANDPEDLVQPPRADRPWRYIVLHHSAHSTGSYAQIDREHRARLGTAGCGYHFVIGNGTESPDGLIEVAQRWSDQKGGAHCRDARSGAINDQGIGICLVGDLDHSPPTPQQVEAARALVEYLCDRYDIPAENVGTHAMLAHNPTACPGKLFPTQAILGGRNLAAR